MHDRRLLHLHYDCGSYPWVRIFLVLSTDETRQEWESVKADGASFLLHQRCAPQAEHGLGFEQATFSPRRWGPSVDIFTEVQVQRPGL